MRLSPALLAPVLLALAPCGALADSTDNESAAGSPGARGEGGVDLCEHMLTDRRYIRAQRQHLGAGRHDVVGGDIIAHLQQ
jgi:hypothetical protein